MKRLTKLRPSPALVVALAALVAATSGAAIALPGKNSVTKNDIRKNAVTGKALATGAVKSKDVARGAIGSKQIKGKSIRGNRLKDKTIKAKQIADDAIGSQQVAAESLNGSDISDYEYSQTGVVTATNGADADAARAAAPAQQLFKKGQLTVYGKCYRDEGTDQVFADVYASTTANGAILDGEEDLSGDPEFLDTDTAEVDRALERDTSALADAATVNETEFTAMAPDGTKLVGQVGTAAKNGTLPAGNGVYGAGSVCLFTAEIAG